MLELHRRELGTLIVRGVSSAGATAERQIHDHLAALAEGIAAPRTPEVARLSWLDFALNPFPDLFTMPPGGMSMKVTDALLKRRFSDGQVGVAYDHLASDEHAVPGGMFGLASYGGQVNAPVPDATASAHRSAILDIACTTGWSDPQDEAKNVAWVRRFYRDLFAETGGAPVPGDAYDGTLINHPDVDLADPAWNTSGVPWHTLYFQAGYPRLQRVKARWDPRNEFRHALSIRPA